MTDGISFDIIANDKTGAAVSSSISNVDRLNQHLASYANTSQEITQLNQKFAGSQGDINKTLKASNGAFMQSMAVGKNYNSMLIEGAKAAKLSTSQVYNMAQASGLWTQKQLAAASVSELLTKRAYQLTDAVKSGKMTTQQAGAQWRNYVEDQQKVINSTMSFTDKLGAMRNTVAGYVATAATIAAPIIAVGKAVDVAYDFSEEGASVLRLRESFKNVANSYNTSSESIIKAMRNASNGTIADTDLMLAANRGMMLGVSTDADELAKITEAAIARGRAMGLSSSEAIDRVYTGIGRLSPKILDDLGIITNASQRYEDYAKAHNTTAAALDDFTKREIIKNAVLEDSRALLGETGGLVDDTASSYERAHSAWKNYWDSVKASNAGTFKPINNWWSGMLQNKADKRNRSNLVMDEYQKYRMERYGREERGPNAANNAERWYRKQEIAAQMDRGKDDIFTPSAISGASTAPEINYAGLLSGGLALTNMTEQFGAKTDEINAKLREEQAVLEQLQRSGYNPLGQKMRDQIAVVNQLKDASTQAAVAQVNAGQQMMSAMLEQAGVSEEAQLEYAMASGQISEDAYKQQEAMLAIADAIATGSMSASDGAAAVAALISNINALDGMTAEAFVNYHITTDGMGPNLPQKTVQQSTSSSSNPIVATMQASGGPLGYAAIVGDAPGGAWTPYTEAIIGGHVYSNKQARAMRDAGLLKGTKNFRVGGDLEGLGIFQGGGGYKPEVYTTPSGGGGGGGSVVNEVVSKVVESVVAGVTQEVTLQTQAANMTMQKMIATNNESVAVLKIIASRIATAGDIGNAVHGVGNKWDG